MLRDITIGQYYPVNSKVHSLDPRTKILLTLLFMISVFAVDNLISYLFVFACLFAVIKSSKVPFGFIFRGMKSIIFIMIFSVVINVFMTPGDIIFKFGFLSVTYQGIYSALIMISRLALMIMGSSLMTYTTTPIRLTDGIEKLLSVFNRFGMPSHEISMMMSMALRFIPVLLEETDKIMKAQMARGADFENGTIFEKAKALIPILIPLFFSALMRADELSQAMESRCYRGGDGRTKLNPLEYKKNDRIAFIVFALYLIAVYYFDKIIVWG